MAKEHLSITLELTGDMAKAMVFDALVLGTFNPFVIIHTVSSAPAFKSFTCYLHGRPRNGHNVSFWGICEDQKALEAAMKTPTIDTIKDMINASHNIRRLKPNADV